MDIESVGIRNEKDGFREESKVSPGGLEGKSDRHLIQDTLELLERPDLFLGEGAIARVFSFSMRDRRFCEKISLQRDVASRSVENVPEKYRKDYLGQAKRREERPWTLAPKIEADFTNRAAAIQDEAVKVPTVYRVLHITGSEEGPGYMVSDTYDVMVMEQVPGVDLDQLVQKGLPLPEGFDVDKFADDLLAFVRKMNQRQIFHRDLAPRNVMLDSETGNPWVIDFGRATGDTNDTQRELFTKDGIASQALFKKTDEECVEIIRGHLREYREYRQTIDNSGKDK
jgi:tRNA A-37 threonylcarbamoyl transferase component Bud32